MEISTYIIIFVAIAIVIRILRAYFSWADWLPYVVVPVATVLLWCMNGALAGIGTFFLSVFTMTYLTGIMSKTTVEYDRGRYSAKCPHCHYGNMKILSHVDENLKVKCKRCGKIIHFRLVDGAASVSSSSYSSSSRSSSYSSSSRSSSSSSYSSREDDDRRRRYEEYRSEANDAYRRYKEYESRAEDALRQARSYQNYANSYRGSDDRADEMTVESYDGYAESALREAEDYSRRASEYYDKYRHYDSLAERYQ